MLRRLFPGFLQLRSQLSSALLSGDPGLPFVSITEVMAHDSKHAEIGLDAGIVSLNEVTSAMHKTLHKTPHESTPDFSLKPGEKITMCSPLWKGGCDRILEEVANCHYCLQPAFRVVTILSSSGLEHRTSLCARHFANAARTFPELHQKTDLRA